MKCKYIFVYVQPHRDLGCFGQQSASRIARARAPSVLYGEYLGNDIALSEDYANIYGEVEGTRKKALCMMR